MRRLSLGVFLLAALPVPGLAQSEPRYDAGNPTLQQIWVDPVRGNDRVFDRYRKARGANDPPGAALPQ